MGKEIAFAIILVLALAALLTVMFLYLILRKLAENRRRIRLNATSALLEKALLEWLLNGTDTRHMKQSGGKVAGEAAERLLERYAQVMSGDEVQARMRLYAEQVFTDRYRNCLRKPGGGTRMNTLRRIEIFDMRHMVHDLRGLMSRPGRLTPEEKVQTCKLLAKWDSTALLPLLEGRSLAVSHYHRRLIAANMDEAAFGRLLADADAYPGEWQLAAIDVVGIKRMEGRMPALLSMLRHTEEEYRIRALKALSELSLVPADERFLQHAGDAGWEERNMAAKLFGKLRDPIYLDALIGLLSDPSWFVRSQSAQSLMRYPTGTALLEQAAASAEDRYAREIAAEWLIRGRET